MSPCVGFTEPKEIAEGGQISGLSREELAEAMERVCSLRGACGVGPGVFS